ncbi:hypothetical protein [Streptomyces xanthochromogenes]|uniref:hypothetical protein n=1 Tax=Streptomyces xanthochromogenes TaxID=67384 RepID=UPI001679AD84|nr:hypothetical protein [Streptomyces xanthochromogenes]
MTTGHKTELGRDLTGYATVTKDVRRLREAGTLRVDTDGLHASAHDVAAGGDIVQELLADSRWETGARHAVVLGAGGAGLALACVLTEASGVRQVILTEQSSARRREVRHILEAAGLDGGRVALAPATQNDSLVAEAPPGTLLVNATGLGKDTPGSPLADTTPLPARSLFWELNYRGQRPLLARAQATTGSTGGRAVDGWDFFVRSWFEALKTILETNWGRDELATFFRCAGEVQKQW